MTPPLRVLLVDDHAAVRAALRRILEQAGHLVCGEGGACSEVLELCAGTRPDVVLLDLRLLDGACIQTARALRARWPALRLVLVTAATDDEAALALALSGAAGLVLKQPAGLAAALAGVLAATADAGVRTGGAPAAVSAIGGRLSDLAADPHGPLTPLERQVLGHVLAGHTDGQIATAAHLSREAVADVLRRLLAVLGPSGQGAAA
ncbi:MAG TPA: response regulator [Mycobacteriales bacterium]|nr:response regulator [Mycobacteriales bacterium]